MKLGCLGSLEEEETLHEMPVTAHVRRDLSLLRKMYINEPAVTASHFPQFN